MKKFCVCVVLSVFNVLLPRSVCDIPGLDWIASQAPPRKAGILYLVNFFKASREGVASELD